VCVEEKRVSAKVVCFEWRKTRSQRGGQGFEPPHVHHFNSLYCTYLVGFGSGLRRGNWRRCPNSFIRSRCESMYSERASRSAASSSDPCARGCSKARRVPPSSSPTPSHPSAEPSSTRIISNSPEVCGRLAHPRGGGATRLISARRRCGKLREFVSGLTCLKR